MSFKDCFTFIQLRIFLHSFNIVVDTSWSEQSMNEIQVCFFFQSKYTHSRAALDTDWLEVREKAEFVFIELKRPSVAIVYSD